MNHHHAISSLSLCLLIGLGAFASTALGQNNSEIFAEISGDPRAGSDGELVVAPGQTVQWNLPGDDTSIYRFSRVNIGAGATLKIRANHPGMKEGRPLYFLVNGPVVIDGTLDLNGDRGHDCLDENHVAYHSVPGPGGYAGARGQHHANGLVVTLETTGRGPGGGDHFTDPARHAFGDQSRPAYGNIYLRPLVGGSGGGRGSRDWRANAAGGGAGGGAILIASTDRITVNGIITARGGDGGDTAAGPGVEIRADLQGLCRNGRSSPGGGGSAGAIRLLAPTISGQGQLNVDWSQMGNSEPDHRYRGSYGRTRIEANAHNHSITAVPDYVLRRARPSPTGLQAPLKPRITVLSVDGVDVRENPDGDLGNPDVFFTNAAQAVVRYETENMPLGGEHYILVVPEEETYIWVDSLPRENVPLGIQPDPNWAEDNTDQRARFVATVTFPPGHSQIFVWARW